MAEPVGRVVKVQGEAEVRDSAGQRRAPARVGTTLNAGESLHASGKSAAALQTTAGDVIVVDSNAAVRVKDEQSTFEQLVGKILYFFRSSKRIDRRVELQTVAVGVRGTTFLVDTTDKEASIALKEGKVDVDSKGDGFNLYRRKEQAEFEAFKQEIREGIEQERKEFDRYRALVSHDGIFDLRSMYSSTEELWFVDWEFGGPPWEQPETYLAKTAERLREDRLSAQTRLLHGDPARALVAAARQDGCSLIVLTSHGLGGLASRVFGSVAQKVLASAPCPVVVLPCSEAELLTEEESEELAADESMLGNIASVAKRSGVSE